MKRLLFFAFCFIVVFVARSQEGENYTEAVNGIQLKMVYVKGGTFQMGSPINEMDRGSLEVQHSVTLSDFYIMECEVTQKQWQAIMGENPSFFKDCDNCPVETVSWTDIQKFIAIINQSTGKKYALPTEAQWEYACRAGTATQFNTGNCLGANQANYDGNSPYCACVNGAFKEKPVAVKSYRANAWGIYDMHGNVHEWCSDNFGAYPRTAQTDPKGADTGTFKIIRGGNWNVAAKHCRCAARNYYTPEYKGRTVGFRLVCNP